jgi:hypothetical protein
MQKWEYCEVGSFVSGSEVVDFINFYEKDVKFVRIENINEKIVEIGKRGWEMLQVTKDYERASYAYYFKRPIEE